MEVSSSPVVKIISLPSAPKSFYLISGSKIFFVSESDNFRECFKHPGGKKWSNVAALSEDETFMAVCDNEKNLHVFVVGSDKVENDDITTRSSFKLKCVTMRLAKTATSVKFTGFPSLNTIVIADKFGDVLRFEMEEFEKWALESKTDGKSLSIHTRKSSGSSGSKKRGIEEVEAANVGENTTGQESDAEEEDGTSTMTNEAHLCTIIGHISMITDLQILPIDQTPGGLIITCDRDEKIRLTRADRPEIIHSFSLAHREYLASIAVSPESKTFFGAGGDSFVSEWKLDTETGTAAYADGPYGSLKLLSKINLSSPSDDSTNSASVVAVQEIHANSRGDLLTVLVEDVGILVYSKSGDEWSLKGRIENGNITTFDYLNGIIVYSTWNSQSGKNEIFTVDTTTITIGSEVESEAVVVNPEMFDEAISREEGEEVLLSFLSKRKLRKDIERMDWKQKKHSNQKPRQ